MRVSFPAQRSCRVAMAMEESRSIVAMEVSSSMAQISASFGSSGSSCGVRAVEEVETQPCRPLRLLHCVGRASAFGLSCSMTKVIHITTMLVPRDNLGDANRFVQFRRQQLQQEIMQAKARYMMPVYLLPTTQMTRRSGV